MLGPNQVELLARPNAKVTKWTNEEYQRAVQFYNMCPRKMYSWVRTNLVPLPKIDHLAKALAEGSIDVSQVPAAADYRERPGDTYTDEDNLNASQAAADHQHSVYVRIFLFFM